MTNHWYVLNVYSTFEDKVKKQILEQAEMKGLSDKFAEIIVPVEKVVDVKNGKKVEKDSRLFPGYILLHMELTDESWHLVNSTPKVTGFLGAGNRPCPVPENEAQKLAKQLEQRALTPRSTILFQVGDQVRITDGAFDGFSASVEEVNPEKNRLKVIVKVFERNTPVELEFEQVEQI